MKKIICIALALLMLFLIGCGNVDETTVPVGEPKGYVASDYDIISSDGESYIRFEKENAYEGYYDDSVSGWYVAGLSFESVTELKSKVSEKKLSDEEKAHIANRFAKDDKGNVKICDFDNLYEAVLPESVQTSRIDWYGTHYDIYFSSFGDSKERVNGSVIQIKDKNEFDIILKQRFDEVYANKNVVIDRVELSDNGNLKTIFCHTVSSNLKILEYTIQDGDKEYFVYEHYVMWDKYSSFEVSDVVPAWVHIEARDGDAYFGVYLSVITERPSVEFIKSFGIKKFEG